MALKSWVKLPTAWIEAGGLTAFHWKRGEGPNGVAALMVLTTIAHHADEQNGIARMTYDVLTTATGLSRTKVAHGLNVLEQHGMAS